LPLGITMTTPKVYQVFRKSGSELRSGSTYGGHTTACATTLANIEIIERENLVQKAAQMGAYVKSRLEKMRKKSPIIGDIRGIGLLWAVELLADRKTRKPLDPKLKIGNAIREYCWNHGMILRNNGDILVIAPALTITKKETDFMLDLIENAIIQVRKKIK
jgi:adenosylmethionine-8-amino-7-oxononanoate aminotransferase